jgi:hypothetical protein
MEHVENGWNTSRTVLNRWNTSRTDEMSQELMERVVAWATAAQKTQCSPKLVDVLQHFDLTGSGRGKVTGVTRASEGSGTHFNSHV